MGIGELLLFIIFNIGSMYIEKNYQTTEDINKFIGVKKHDYGNANYKYTF